MKYTLFLTLALLACGRAEDAYPRLLPTAQILAEPTLPDHAPRAASSAGDETQARADALRQRADALRGPVIEPDSLSRMGPRE